MKQGVVRAAASQRRRIEALAALSLAGVLLFFLVSGVIDYVNLQTLRGDAQKLVRSQSIITLMDLLLIGLGDAETAQRGFILTGQESYLQPYENALISLPNRLDKLASLSSDDPAQQARMPALRGHIAAKLAELKQTIDTRRSQGFDAALAIVNGDRGKIEMDAVRDQLEGMRQEESELRLKRIAEMDSASEVALAAAIVTGIVGAALAAAIAFMVRRASLQQGRNEWLQVGQFELAAVMLGDLSVEQLGENILAFFARYVGAVAGAAFVGGGEGFRRAAVYGVPADHNVPERVARKEGLLGQVASENRILALDEVPDDYLAVGSALGRGKPSRLVIFPGAVDGYVNSVVELGFMRALDPNLLTLLAQAGEPIAVALRSADYRGERQRMLEETLRQSEELQVQGEELRVSNEELEEQGRALKESQARLEVQQVELEQTNTQLEGQRDDLERAHDAVKLKARELEQASRYKSDFLANMSHELRTPLNSSLILAKLLADNPEQNLSKEQVRYAQTIQSSGNDLLTLINDILDLSKIEAGHVEIRPEMLTLARLSNDLRRTFQPIAEQRKLAFKIEIAPESPDSVETDAQRLEQVLKNLLSNAFKFTESGEVRLSMRRAAEARLALSVTDTGIGISEDQQARVFEAFHQADGTISRKYGGTGLGLSISRELVRLLGGEMTLASRPGEGSTFTVLIPETYDPAKVAARDDRPPPAPAPIAPAALAPPPPRAVARRANRVQDDRDDLADSRRILLVVEDDETFGGILRDISREMGFRSLVAGTAEEALALARQYTPSAVILDVGLPDQSGLSVLDRLKRDEATRHIPIHIVSAGDHAETALSLGAVGYMLKPVRREQLVEVMGKLEAKLSQSMRRVLIVEDDLVQREAVAKLLSSQDVETVTAGTAAECLGLLKNQTFDCMVLDLTLPDASGYQLLETLSQEGAYAFPPVIVYTGRELSADDEQRLRRYSKSIIIKGAKSPERLLDEVTLFLHQVVSELPDEQQRMIRKARNRDALLEGRRILVVEDDVRNVYALTNVLEPRGASVEIARNGREAIEALQKSATRPELAIDLVLMDVMMPVMDGLAATQEIRRDAKWRKLPIIALTAKAMPDDQQRCIEAGANDYMAKPLDVEKLLSLVRVWMPR